MAKVPKAPALALALVEYVESLYPDRCPALTDTDRDIWFKAGQAEVARKLRFEFSKQNTLVEK